MINELLNAHLAFLYPLFTCFYALELAIQTHEVKVRRGTDTEKSAPPPFLFQKVSSGNICLNSPGAGVYKEGEKQNEPRGAVQRQLPLVCYLQATQYLMLKEMCVCSYFSATSL